MKEKEIHDKIIAERNNEINTFSDKSNYHKLTYLFKSEVTFKAPISFNHFNCPLCLIRKIKDGPIDLEKAKKLRKI